MIPLLRQLFNLCLKKEPTEERPILELKYRDDVKLYAICMRCRKVTTRWFAKPGEEMKEYAGECVCKKRR